MEGTLGSVSVSKRFDCIINSTTGKYCSVAFIQMDKLQVLVPLISNTPIFTSEVIPCSIISIIMLESFS